MVSKKMIQNYFPRIIQQRKHFIGSINATGTEVKITSKSFYQGISPSYIVGSSFLKMVTY